MKKEARKIIILLIVILLFSYITYSLSFVTVPDIDNTTKSEDDVICSWISSGDTTQINVTWYNATAIATTHPNVGSDSDILFENFTKREENWTCQVTLSNSTNIISQNVSVIIKNSDPTGLAMYNSSNDNNLGNGTNLDEDTTYIFYLNASDYDGDPLLYSYIETINATLYTNGTFIWIPEYTDAGINNVTFLVTDGYIDLGIDALVFVMNVSLVNDAPVFITLLNQNATEGVYFEYNVSAADEENNFPLNITITSDDGIGLQITNLSNTSAKLSFTPTFSDVGNHTIILNVTDSLGKSSQSSFDIEINPVNHAPTFTYLENASANQSNQFTMQINATDIDTNDSITYFIESPGCPYPGLWSIQTINSSPTNAVGQINTTLTNQHIVCRNVTIIAGDTKLNTTTNRILNLTNINDAPVIYDNSTYPTNSANNINLTNLSAYSLVEFRYRVNYTDVDNLTYEGENYAITDNSTLFTINSSTGQITFTPNASSTNKTYNILINASDDAGLWTSKIMTIFIYNNTAPIISPTTPNMSTSEKSVFIYDVNATDAEGDNITYSINYSTISGFPINSLTGLINYTSNQSDVGNNTIIVRATDTLGTYSENTFILQVNNTNDAPILSNISLPVLVDNVTISYNISASDEDLLLPSTYENLTFWINWINSTTNLTNLFNLTKISSTIANINFTPNSSMVGNYTIRIGVNDTYNLSDYQDINFTIYPPTLPPQIINITPHDTPTNFSWENASIYPGYTNINASEGISILFNHSTYNPEAGENITYFWYVDGVLNSANHSYYHYFGYSSSGTVNISLRVEDDKYGYDTFSWIADVTDINRPVQYIGDPTNLTIIAQTTYPDGLYLKINNLTGVFYDPDDDTNQNGQLDTTESNNLIITSNYYSGNQGVLNIIIQNTSITFVPLGTGIVRYRFTADDGYVNVTTNPIEFNVSYTPITVPQVVTVTKKKPVYYQVEVDKIINLDIITPKSVTLYANNTATVPIIIKNTGNDTLTGISLKAVSKNEELKMRFEKDSFEQLFGQQEETTNLYIESYRTQGTYEIEVIATVLDPSFEDKALILVSSIEKEEGDTTSLSTTKTKISFAKDLLSSNPKCLDLNEQLEDVQNDMETGRLKAAQEKLENIINTCRYLTSQKEPIEESPNIIYVSLNRIRNNAKLYYSILSIMLLSTFGIGFSIYYTNKKDED